MSSEKRVKGRDGWREKSRKGKHSSCKEVSDNRVSDLRINIFNRVAKKCKGVWTIVNFTKVVCTFLGVSFITSCSRIETEFSKRFLFNF